MPLVSLSHFRTVKVQSASILVDSFRSATRIDNHGMRSSKPGDVDARREAHFRKAGVVE